jgi:hypothetical protein
MRPSFFRKLLRKILAFLVKATLKKHRPIIIFVKGNKYTSVVSDLLYKASINKFNPRKSLERTESEFSIPLSILGYLYYPKNNFEWIKILIRSFIQLIWISPYKHLLIIEIREITPSIYKFWLDIIQPSFIIDTKSISLSEFNEIYENKIPKSIEKALAKLKISAKEALENINLEIAPSSTRFKIVMLADQNILIDARYYYHPPVLESVLEAATSFEGTKYLILDKNISREDQKLLEKFQTKLISDTDEIDKSTTFVLSIISSKKLYENQITSLR